MTNSPTASVVIPTYNRAHLVLRAVRSVLDQTFADFEVIVADDASTDDTEAVVGALDDPRVRYLRCERNGGNAAARNLGWRSARGRFICFLDSDDEYRPAFLERVIDAFEQAPPEVGFLWTGITRVEETATGRNRATELIWQPGPAPDRYLQFLHTLRVGTDYGFSVRREAFDVVGPFDEQLRVAVDRDFILRIVQHYGFIALPEPLVVVHDHAGARVRKDTTRNAAAYEILIEKHRAALEADRELWARYHYKTAWLHYHAGNKVEARRYCLEVLRKHPAHLKTWSVMLLFELFGPGATRIHKWISGAWAVPGRAARAARRKTGAEQGST
jgi:glycosyltransferase involved in cell wall biosynthesis